MNPLSIVSQPLEKEQLTVVSQRLGGTSLQKGAGGLFFSDTPYQQSLKTRDVINNEMKPCKAGLVVNKTLYRPP